MKPGSTDCKGNRRRHARRPSQRSRYDPPRDRGRQGPPPPGSQLALVSHISSFKHDGLSLFSLSTRHGLQNDRTAIFYAIRLKQQLCQAPGPRRSAVFARFPDSRQRPFPGYCVFSGQCVRFPDGREETAVAGGEPDRKLDEWECWRKKMSPSPEDCNSGLGATAGSTAEQKKRRDFALAGGPPGGRSTV